MIAQPLELTSRLQTNAKPAFRSAAIRGSTGSVLTASEATHSADRIKSIV
jgi:hypothetical protein